MSYQHFQSTSTLVSIHDKSLHQLFLWKQLALLFERTFPRWSPIDYTSHFLYLLFLSIITFIISYSLRITIVVISEQIPNESKNIEKSMARNANYRVNALVEIVVLIR